MTAEKPEPGTTHVQSDQKSKAGKKKSGKKEGIGEFIRTIIYAVLIAVVIRTLAYEPFRIPSESMLPTLLVGDFLFVSKFAYGYSRHSAPFSPPVFSGRLFESPVERGDVAVFKLPRDNATDYIKRILGLPGDRMQMKGGHLFINGDAVKREAIEDFVYLSGTRSFKIRQYRETLPNGKSYNTLDLNPLGQADDTVEFTVPEGHYFALGDNRDNSIDSRVPMRAGGVGFIPAENLVGRAEVLFFSKADETSWLTPWNYRFRRMFTGIE